MTRDELIDAVREMRKATSSYRDAKGYAQSAPALASMVKAEAKVDALLAALPPTEAAPVAPVGLSDEQIDAVSSQFALDNGKGPMFIIGRDNARIFARALLAASPTTAPQASEKPSGVELAQLARKHGAQHLPAMSKEGEYEDRFTFYEGQLGELVAALASHAETAPQASEPDAWVPVHPRSGPLWANVIVSLEQDHPSYELRPLYFAATQATKPKTFLRERAQIEQEWIEVKALKESLKAATGASADALDAARYRLMRENIDCTEDPEDGSGYYWHNQRGEFSYFISGGKRPSFEEVIDAALQGTKP